MTGFSFPSTPFSCNENIPSSNIGRVSKGSIHDGIQDKKNNKLFRFLGGVKTKFGKFDQNGVFCSSFRHILGGVAKKIF